MEEMENIKILFIAGFGPIVRDVSASRKLDNRVLGIGFKKENGDYLHTEALEGAKTFALWPLSQAHNHALARIPGPTKFLRRRRGLSLTLMWLEFDVDNVEQATRELESQGYRMLIKNKKEPWDQTVSRFVTPEGLLVGITFTPALRPQK